MQDTAVYVNHGLASLAGALRDKGFRPEILVLDSSAYRSGHWLKRVADENHILAGISIYSNQWQFAVAAARSLKQHCGIPVVGGGPHCSLFPEALASADVFDAFVVGEGEPILPLLADRARTRGRFGGIPGVWTRSATGNLVPALSESKLAELEALAEPAYDLYSRDVVLNYPGLMFSRGCPYSCSYCCNSAYRRRFGAVRARFLSPERAVQRARAFVARFQPTYLNFDDDTFTKNVRWMESFLQPYRRVIGLPFHCNARPETVTAKVCRLLKDAGCNTVSLGCESGSEELRTNVLGRRMRDDAIIRAADCIHEAGLNLATFNMVGIPGERWPDYLRTVALNRRLAPNKVQMTVYYPFRGTPLGDSCFERGLVKNNRRAASYFANTVLHLPGFRPWRVHLAQRMFKFLVFIRTAPGKACFELMKDTIKSLPFGHRFVQPWIRLKRLAARTGKGRKSANSCTRIYSAGGLVPTKRNML
jgi:radical SAM superfamily enzyme YgiQ (UPF0313 family)